MRLVLDARTASFAAMIDYAGLFPPSSLDMERAVSTYRSARASQARWVAGRFLCPASKLEELAGVLTTTAHREEDPWEIASVFDIAPGQAASLSQSFHSEMQPVALVAAAEAKIAEPTERSVGHLIDAISSIQPDVVPFLEVIPSAPIDDQIRFIARALRTRGLLGGAKLRCGGTAATLFPEPATVASFVAAATEAGLPFKATAGLHQPIRHFDTGLSVWRHGFINILVASLAAATGASRVTVTDIVEETDATAFSISTAFVTWRDISIPGPAVRRIRAAGFVGYGSCDFFEPVEALQELSFLGEGT